MGKKNKKIVEKSNGSANGDLALIPFEITFHFSVSEPEGENYEPYGEEWVREMQKNTKYLLLSMLHPDSKAGISEDITKMEIIELLKDQFAETTKNRK